MKTINRQLCLALQISNYATDYLLLNGIKFETDSLFCGILVHTDTSIACFMGGLLLYLVMRPEGSELSPQRLDFIYYESPRIFRMSLLAKSS